MATVSSTNLTTLYSGSGVNIRPSSAYGNSNVVSLLNAGTDGSNTISNIIATGTITANNFVGNFVGNIVVPGSNTEVLFNSNGNAGASNRLTFNSSTGVLTANGNINANYFSGDGYKLSNITGGNVTGAVAFATTANSVAGANVSGYVANANHANISNSANSVAVANVVGIGNIATINLSGNGSQVLLGNGTWGAGSGGNATNANYANYAGNAFSVDGGNVVGAVGLATYATTANSVAGANVSGAVGLATYATTANSVAGSNVSGQVAFAATANSVAVANVSGIGNIAVINLDGNSGNILYGNGVFSSVPVVSNVANANYANFAGQVVDATQSNITALGTLGNLSVTGTITTGTVNAGNVSVSGTSISTLNDLDLQIQANGIHISDTTSASEVDVFANGVYVKTGGDTYNWQFSETGNLVLPGNTFSVNYANGSPVNLDGPVANANYANFAGTAYSVSGANVSGEVANANYATYAGTAYSVSGANVTGTVANANYAAYAGNVTIASQGNITTVGNLLSLNINNTAANTRSPQFQFIPTGSNVSNAGSPLSSMIYNDYGSQASNANPMNWSFVKYRGNATTPTAGANNDNILRLSSHVYNGNTTPRAAIISTTAPLAANTLFTAANVAWTPGQILMSTGNPNGNITSATATSSQNLLQWTQLGQLNLIPGTYGATYGILITNYGSNSDGSGFNAGTISTIRYRGNRDSNAAVGNGDGVGGTLFQAYNGTSLATVGAFRAFVNTDYGPVTAGGTIGGQFQVQVNGNTGTYITNFNGDGSVVFPANNTVTLGNLTAGNSNLGNLAIASFFSGDGSLLSNINGANVSNVANANYANFAGQVVDSTQSNITSVGTLTSLTVSGTGNIANLQLNQFQENVYAIGSTSGTITPDFINGSIQSLTLSGNITLNTLGNAIAGRSMTLIVTQGSGGQLLTSSMKFAGGLKTLSSSASAVDIISVFYSGSTYYATLSRGYV